MGYDWGGFEELEKKVKSGSYIAFMAQYGTKVIRAPSTMRIIARMTPRERSAFGVIVAELEHEVDQIAEGK